MSEVSARTTSFIATLMEVSMPKLRRTSTCGVRDAGQESHASREGFDASVLRRWGQRVRASKHGMYAQALPGQVEIELACVLLLDGYF